MSRSIKRSRSCDVGHIFSDGGQEGVFWQATHRMSSADRRGWSSEGQEATYRKGQRLVVIEENEIARLQVLLSEEAQIKEMMELSVKMFTDMGNEWDEASSEDKQEYA